MRNRSAILVPILALAFLPSLASGDRLVLISPHSDVIQIEFEEGFRRHYRKETGRDVSLEWLDVGGGTSSILRYIKSECGRRPEGSSHGSA